MRRLHAIPIDRPRIFIMIYDRCLLNDLILCLIRFLNMTGFHKLVNN
jgi:hypothetical protein